MKRLYSRSSSSHFSPIKEERGGQQLEVHSPSRAATSTTTSRSTLLSVSSHPCCRLRLLHIHHSSNHLYSISFGTNSSPRYGAKPGKQSLFGVQLWRSSLVLPADTSTLPRRDKAPDSVAGRIDSKDMGSMVQCQAQKYLDKKKQKTSGRVYSSEMVPMKRKADSSGFGYADNTRRGRPHLKTPDLRNAGGLRTHSLCRSYCSG